MRILSWHVHAAWSTAFVQGGHDYLVPALPDRGPYGRGRPRTYPWPDNAVEVSPEELAGADVDLVILQRPEEEELARRWLGRRVPALYVEHNTPRGDVPGSRHPLADRDDITIVHVTHFNDLFWDCGATRTVVIEHGVPDPGPLWTGELERLAVVTNEPVRRGRVTGTDLMTRFTPLAPVDVFGINVAPLADLGLHPHEDPPQAKMHRELAHRRAYLHLTRWTSLGLSLVEAMTMGCPVVVLATTEACMAVPPGAGVLSTNVADLVEGARHFLTDPGAAREAGRAAREFATGRYGLGRFLTDWDALLAATARTAPTGTAGTAPTGTAGTAPTGTAGTAPTGIAGTAQTDTVKVGATP